MAQPVVQGGLTPRPGGIIYVFTFFSKSVWLLSKVFSDEIPHFFRNIKIVFKAFSRCNHFYFPVKSVSKLPLLKGYIIN